MIRINAIKVGDVLTDKVEIGGLLFGGNMEVISICGDSATVKILDYYEQGKLIKSISNEDRFPLLKLGYNCDNRTGKCYVHLRKYEDMLIGYEFSEKNKKKLFLNLCN